MQTTPGITMYDDQEMYFDGLIGFIQDVDQDQTSNQVLTLTHEREYHPERREGSLHADC